MTGTNVHTFDETNFAREVLEQPDLPVLVSFAGTWAGQGQALAPLVEQLAEDFAGKIKVGQVDYDELHQLAAKYGVLSAPAVVVFRGGRKSGLHIGPTTRERLMRLLGV